MSAAKASGRFIMLVETHRPEEVAPGCVQCEDGDVGERGARSEHRSVERERLWKPPHLHGRRRDVHRRRVGGDEGQNAFPHEGQPDATASGGRLSLIDAIEAHLEVPFALEPIANT